MGLQQKNPRKLVSAWMKYKLGWSFEIFIYHESGAVICLAHSTAVSLVGAHSDSSEVTHWQLPISNVKFDFSGHHLQ